MNYQDYFKNYLDLIEPALEDFIPGREMRPAVLHEAMRYAVFSGGKRFRPVLTLAACEAAGGNVGEALIPACSIELIHCYSLVQDDLPALDNDDMRRGKPTCHKKFGEDIAILASDGLLTAALQILGRVRPAERAVRLLEEISTSAGTCGMIGGQAADLAAQHQDMDLPMLDYISIHKTGKLIKACAVSGAIAANADPETMKRILHYGESIGLAFQLVDDLLDGDGYMRHMKAKELEENIRDLMAKAKKEIKPFAEKSEKLNYLIDFLINRIPGETCA
ncbi:MAG: polyprenyl synthetase family protein [Candidatus Omnitrophica bacterium]|nr:polyprenyl synthetase family protein [Candidatus Omnitrophota bacterium]